MITTTLLWNTFIEKTTFGKPRLLPSDEFETKLSDFIKPHVGKQVMVQVSIIEPEVKQSEAKG